MKVYFEDRNESELGSITTRPDWVCPRKDELVILSGKKYQVLRVTHDYGKDGKIVVTLC